MKIAVIGVGAMGSVYAGLLADAGNEVHAIDIWEDHVQIINSDGLRISGASGDRLVQSIQAHSDTKSVGVCELIIIATKASGVEHAAMAAKEIADQNSLILTIQNGLGAAQRINAVSDNPNIILGVAAGFGASMKGPGHVRHNKMELIRVGEMQGGLTERLTRVTKIWHDAGFKVKAFEDINQLIWEKFVCNVAFSGPCTVFNMTLGELMNDPHAWSVAKACALEAYQAGCAKQVNFTFDDVVDYVTEFGNNMPEARPSMLLDHMQKRKSEIDAINGMVPVVAHEVGTSAPYNEVISAIVRSRELSF